MIDGGSKTFSGDRLVSGDRLGFGLVAEDPGIQFVSMSEEHGHLILAAQTTGLGRGQLTVIPNAFMVRNMHDRFVHPTDVEVWTVEGAGRSGKRSRRVIVFSDLLFFRVCPSLNLYLRLPPQLNLSGHLILLL
jgi:hypothetical protein